MVLSMGPLQLPLSMSYSPYMPVHLYDGRERRRRIIEDEGKKQCEEEIVCDVLRLLYLNLQRLKRPLYRPKSQLQFWSTCLFALIWTLWSSTACIRN